MSNPRRDEPAAEDLLSVPVFPLPDYVLFPGTIVPFHLFEPRYRNLAVDCLAGNRLLVIGGLMPGWEADYHGTPAVHRVAGIGKVLGDERLSDGRFNLVVYGQERVFIEDWVQSQPYRRARVVPLTDEVQPDRKAELEPQFELLKGLALELAVKLGGPGGALARSLRGVSDLGALTFKLASMIVGEPPIRQKLLEMRCPLGRADLLIQRLGDALLNGPWSSVSANDPSIMN